MALSNYGGRQSDTTSTIKVFYVESGPYANWVYRNVLTKGYITPENKTKNVLIEKDLIVNGAIINPSDANIKKDVKDVTMEDINNISLLNPKVYNYIDNYDDGNKRSHYGFIAQELETVYPNLITKIPNKNQPQNQNEEQIEELDEIKGINYSELLPLLVGKINHMQIEMDEMRKEINEMKEHMNK